MARNSSFATIVLTYFLVLELTGDAWLALLAMIVSMSTQYFIKYSMHAMTDVPCAFFVLLAIFAYLKSLRRPAYFLLCGIAIGLTILTRSVVGLLPLGVFLLYSPPKSGRVARSAGAVPYALTGLALAFAIPGVWYASQYAMHGDAFISGHLRFTESKLFAGHLTMPQRITGLLTYPKLLLRGYWPWVPLLALGFVKQLRRAFSGDRAALLLMLWAGCILLPFSIAEVKVLRYLMPAFPAFAIIVATSLNDWIPTHRRPLFLRCAYGFAIAGTIYVLFFPFLLPRAGDMKQLAPIAAANSPADQNLLLYTWGRTEFSYNNQLLWYGNRFTELPTILEGVKGGLEGGDHSVVIVDRELYRGFPDRLGPGLKVAVLGESENFICFKVAR